MRRCLPVALLALGLALTLAVTGCSTEPSAARDEAGAVATAGSVDAFALELGDCVEEPGPSGEEVEEVESVQAVPCGEPHTGEVYSVFDLPDGDFPGDDAVATAGEERCVTDFGTFVGLPYEESKYEISSLFPTQQSWEQQDDREYVCIVVAPEGEQITGSAKGLKA